ncbi:amino acid adenylation domain-containing protein [Paenibacillus cellulosilyticus]|uniref:Amino acid adenylation domain-containing protein n=1 Tax=Paenibacillus cellulosilyticus TaxID=375489 RepID=A0A2V2YUD0_9BACL|nr:amino acid adenylation domain-containing protein [Paenibacillus cellulosilyticus]PWW03198.1 amino acid adenylation domain-containing protein [Paenibacillus cellulosilyticus]QKS43688.1 amino acid adenylation domain-containing protein [Paenibacillus cellulosilyticus]
MSIIKQFESIAQLHPEKTAIIYGTEHITYKKLNEKANQIAANLINTGVQPGEVIGLLMDRSIEIVVGLLGILKSGSAFCPLEPSLPKSRINLMIQDCKIRIILTTSRQAYSEFIGHFIPIDFMSLLRESSHNPDLQINQNSLVYVIYTSGTTGKPKGVMIEHQSLQNLFDGLIESIDFASATNFLASTSFSFDIFMVEVLFPLYIGRTVILADDRSIRNTRLLSKLISTQAVDFAQFTPSKLFWLLSDRTAGAAIDHIKILFVGGEPFPPLLLETTLGCTKANIYNMYGPTETTIWSSYKRLSNPSEAITIGTPIKNTTFIALNTDGEPIITAGNVGELCILGRGVAKGYMNDPSLTASKFSNVSDDRMYVTGDVVKIMDNGEYQIIGRKDLEVKIKGHRINIHEIEEAIVRLTPATATVVIPHLDMDGFNRLHAFIVANVDVHHVSWRTLLSPYLPDYLIPNYFHVINNIPLLSNGKTDRKQLIQLLSLSN